MGKKAHLAKTPKNIRMAVITVSSSRDEKTDKSGKWIKKRAKREKADIVFYTIVTDDRDLISKTLTDVIAEQAPHVVVLTGGTGISRQDVTIEAVRPFFEKEMTAFSALFARLSFEQIDSAAILSRATAGLVGETAVFCIPGSLTACKLACNELIFPEIMHIAAHIAPLT
ncbi:MAG: molybdenum cofactor biosynthesis protein MoaB [Deltaproteobacteria bacterium]|nr:molybdenum cofactor biosynthesis protein MoaB [Deltaproteobacteria bacterium]